MIDQQGGLAACPPRRHARAPLTGDAGGRLPEGLPGILKLLKHVQESLCVLLDN